MAFGIFTEVGHQPTSDCRTSALPTNKPHFPWPKDRDLSMTGQAPAEYVCVSTSHAILIQFVASSPLLDTWPWADSLSALSLMGIIITPWSIQ